MRETPQSQTQKEHQNAVHDCSEFPIDRRAFIRLLGGGAAAAVVAGCSDNVSEEPAKKHIQTPSNIEEGGEVLMRKWQEFARVMEGLELRKGSDYKFSTHFSTFPRIRGEVTCSQSPFEEEFRVEVHVKIDRHHVVEGDPRTYGGTVGPGIVRFSVRDARQKRMGPFETNEHGIGFSEKLDRDATPPFHIEFP